MKLQFPVLKGLYEPPNDRKAVGHLGLIRSTKFEVSIGLEFLRSLTERVTQTLTKLQLDFALCRITIGKAFLAEVIDCRQNFLKFIDTMCSLFDESVF